MSTRSRVVRGNSLITVQVTGASAIEALLAKWLEPELTAHLDAANKIAAQGYGKALKAEVRGVSKRMARAVRVKRAKTGKPGWIVGSRRKVAFWWPFVIGGTKDHGPKKAKLLVWVTPDNSATVRATHVRGVRANPMVDAVATRNESRLANGIDHDMTRMTGT